MAKICNLYQFWVMSMRVKGAKMQITAALFAYVLVIQDILKISETSATGRW